MKMMSYAALGAALAFSSTAAGKANPPLSIVSVTDLGTLGGSLSRGFGVNNKGQVAGTSEMPGDKSSHGFFYADGKMTDLGTLGGDQSEAHALNDVGQVTGNAEIKPKEKQHHAFLWQQGQMHELGTSRADSSDGLAINSDGQVAGRIIRGAFGSSRACLWRGGKANSFDDVGTAGSDIDAVNDKNQFAGTVRKVGRSFTDPIIYETFSDHAVLWNGRKMSELAPHGTEVSLANGVNDSGQVVGAFSVGPEMALHACSWQDGKMTDIGTLAGQNTVVYAINQAGLIVGGTNPADLEENGKQFGEADQPQHAFCCSKGQVIDLNDLVDPASGWVLADARGISNSGYVTGTGFHNGQFHAYLLRLPEKL